MVVGGGGVERAAVVDGVEGAAVVGGRSRRARRTWKGAAVEGVKGGGGGRGRGGGGGGC